MVNCVADVDKKDGGKESMAVSLLQDQSCTFRIARYPLYVHIDGPRTMGLFVLVISVASSNYFVAQRMDAAEVPCRGERPYPVEPV